MFCKTVRCHEFFFFFFLLSETNLIRHNLYSKLKNQHSLLYILFILIDFSIILFKNKLNNETFKTITMQSSNQPNLSENQNTRSNKGGRRRRRPRNRKHKTISAENKQGHTVDKESSLNLTDLSR